MASPLAPQRNYTSRYIKYDIFKSENEEMLHQQVYYYFTTFESENIRSYDDICEYLPKTAIPKILVNVSYNGI